jgi:hypothetical protein
MAISKISFSHINPVEVKDYLVTKGWELTGDPIELTIEILNCTYARLDNKLRISVVDTKHTTLTGPTNDIRQIADDLKIPQDQIEYTWDQLRWTKSSNDDYDLTTFIIEEFTIRVQLGNIDRPSLPGSREFMDLSDFIEKGVESKMAKLIESTFNHEMMLDILGVANAYFYRPIKKDLLGSGAGGFLDESPTAPVSKPAPVSNASPEIKPSTKRHLSSTELTTISYSRTEVFLKGFKYLSLPAKIVGAPFFLFMFIYGLVRLVRLITISIQYEFFIASAYIVPILLIIVAVWMYFNLCQYHIRKAAEKK